ncbi:CPBP family intramembrane glutamic endopeptidase [uncultured Sphingomonas sp.]|uniref:CPBP family intramembrane glutamic endopeptidase n=1 Tax=uncultured Sphingomonas sp. TaxID=158754 RepID=UPI0035C981CB
MNAWPTALLLAALLPMVRQVRGARAAPMWRGNRFRRFAIGALWRFGLPVPVLLVLAGRASALVMVPPEFAPVTRLLGLGDRDPWLVGGMVAGALLGMAAASGIAAWRAWRGRSPRYWFGEFASLEATDPADRGWATVLSFVAGLTEEGYFRLLLPLLAAMARPGGGGALAGFAGSTALFGFAHRYQGWRGVATTTVVGAGLTALYLGSGSLALAIGYHALIDVGSLVVRPWVRQAVRRRKHAKLFSNR